MIFGTVSAGMPLTITSHMSDNGIIFSDGIEADYLQFISGTTATIGVAKQKANILVSKNHQVREASHE